MKSFCGARIVCKADKDVIIHEKGNWF